MSDSCLDLTLPLERIPRSIRNADSLLPDLIAEALKCPADCVPDFTLLKKSVDARKKSAIVLRYRVALGVLPPAAYAGETYKDVLPKKTVVNPIVIGAGPAGLAAAWALARAGCKPLVLEQGEKVDARAETLASFFTSRIPEPHSNFLFGEGGAGTFSDGKLYTRIRDERCRALLHLFVACGAPESILYDQRPHIGSDRLPGMICAWRKEIESLGGTFRFNTVIKRIVFENQTVRGVELENGECLESPAVIAAFGHSATPLMSALAEENVACALKPFQVGCRIEHEQAFINHLQYGRYAENPHLCVPEYHISSTPRAPDVLPVSSFCMCPGGEIIPAVAEPGRLCTNGMSVHARSGKYANAALIATLTPDRFKDLRGAFHLIKHLEQNAYFRGGENYSAPAQDAVAFVREERGLAEPEATSYRLGLCPARLDRMVPKVIKDALQSALIDFEYRLPGFAQYGTLAGIEARVSSPLRFLRQEETLESLSHKGLFLSGEGAGCAGGIVSAAVDGLKCAEGLLCRAEHF